MREIKRLRAETDEAYGTLLAGLGVSIPKSHAYIDALAAERAHGEKELVAKDAEIARLRAELGYIGNAKRFDREAFDSIEEFAAWAQSRARHALAEDET